MTLTEPTLELQEGDSQTIFIGTWAPALTEFNYSYTVTSFSASPADYTVTPVVTSFKQGDIDYTSVSLRVQALTDVPSEGREKFLISVTTPDLTRGTGDVTVNYPVAILEDGMPVGEPRTELSEGGFATFFVADWAPEFSPLSYSYSAIAGSATAADYTVTPVLESFMRGDIAYNRLSFRVGAVVDSAVEGDESFSVSVTVNGQEAIRRFVIHQAGFTDEDDSFPSEADKFPASEPQWDPALANTLNALGGNDIVHAGAAGDSVDGGGGDDLLYGDAGNDTLKGGAGKDTLDGGVGLDTADYGDKTLAVSAKLAAAANALVLVGGVVEDTVRNIENVSGGAGNDLLTGDGLANILTGGAGIDTLKGSAGKDTLDGGAGLDTADYGDKTLAVSVKLAAAANALVLVGGVVEDTVRNIENVTGGAGNDLLTGDGLANILTGGTGNDTLKGSAGKDTLDGGAGLDTADYGDKTLAVSVKLAAAANALVLVGGVVEDTVRNVENVSGGAGNDLLTGDGLANILTGGTGNDTLKGSAGKDTLDGGVGLDTADYGDKTLAVSVKLAAAANALVLVGGVVEDTVRNVENVSGGAGNDLLTGDGLANILTGGTGNDTLKGSAGKDTLDGGAGLDTADYGDKTLAVSVKLAAAANALVLVGGVVEDTVRNIENVTGGAGSDLLTGDGLANILTGGAGIDTLTGGGGRDTLIGGSSGDFFKYTSLADSGISAATRDLVADFAQGFDKIDLSAIDANAGLALDQAFAFVAAASFSGVAGQLRSVAGATNTIVSGDVNGDAAADFSIELTGVHTLTAANFML